MIALPDDIGKEIKQRVASLTPEVIEIRRNIHRHPERSKREQKTADLVSDYLIQLGYETVRGAAIHSVTAVLNGRKEGKTIGLRADMDALKLQEQTGLSFASEVEGVMHACGHDAHTAILLGAAKILADMNQSVPGKVKFLFQPSEEAFPGGALPMIEEGVMENPTVDAALALHLDSALPTGCISIRPGPSIGGVTAVNIKVKGPGGHFSRPKDTVDPIVVASQVIVALQSMVTRRLDYWQPFVLTFGQIIGGTRDNIIPEEVIIRGDMASMDDPLREEAEEHIERLIKGVTEGFGASGEVQFWRGYPTVHNDPEMAALVSELGAGIVGEDNVKTPEPNLGGEDFAYFAQKVPAALWFLGAWDRNKHKTPTHHHDPKFDPDEACIPLGMELMVASALEYLFRNNPIVGKVEDAADTRRQE